MMPLGYPIGTGRLCVQTVVSVRTATVAREVYPLLYLTEFHLEER